MKVLIIGDNPEITGGVCNYTRPIFNYLSEKIDIKYLYSSSRHNPDYNFFFKTKISVDRKYNDCGNVFKVVNSDNLAHNYHQLGLDTKSKKNDKVFEDFIKSENIDIIHIHEIIGFSSNIINIAKKHGVKVIITIHEYWFLCSHRVMVDFDKRICDGPKDFKKCSYCIKSVRKNVKNHSYQKFIFRMKNVFPNILKALIRIKSFFTSNSKRVDVNLNFNEIDYLSDYSKKIEQEAANRLKLNIEALNMSDQIIGVSSSVKDILSTYGVSKEIIMTQHIGSTIAGTSIEHTKKINANNITFGFIGGVGYYKGVHQLLEAFLDMPKEYKERANVKIFGGGDENYIKAMKETIIKQSDHKNKITFYGRYTADDIQNISNEIDISVLPSLCADTAPQTIFESFSCSLPIIAPAVGGFPDFVIHNNNGLLYQKASVKDLSKKMMQVIDSPELCQKFSNNIQPMKSIQKNGDELISLYKSILYS